MSRKALFRGDNTKKSEKHYFINLSLEIWCGRNVTYFLFSVLCLFFVLCLPWNFPGGSDGKASAYNTGNPGSIPGLGRSPGEGNGNPLQYSCLENPIDQRNLVGYSPWGRKESDMTEWLHFLPGEINVIWEIQGFIPFPSSIPRIKSVCWGAYVITRFGGSDSPLSSEISVEFVLSLSATSASLSNAQVKAGCFLATLELWKTWWSSLRPSA